MAAAYQTGTASSPTNLLTTLVTWLVAQGWTQDASAADGSGHRAHLHKSGVYVNLRAAMNEQIWTYNQGAGYGVGVYLGSGYSGAAAWNAQAGAPQQTGTSNVIGAGMCLNSGTCTYYFFDDGLDNICVVVEKSPALYVHMGWGLRLVKLGSATDFPFFWGSQPSHMNTATASGSLPGYGVTSPAPMCYSFYFSTTARTCAFFKGPDGWTSITTGASTSDGYTGQLGTSILNVSGGSVSTIKDHPNYQTVMDRAHQTAFPGALLLPLHVFNRNAAARYQPCGHPAHVFYCTAFGNGFAATEIYPVGGVNYMIFPGFAVKKAA